MGRMYVVSVHVCKCVYGGRAVECKLLNVRVAYKGACSGHGPCMHLIVIQDDCTYICSIQVLGAVYVHYNLLSLDKIIIIYFR